MVIQSSRVGMQAMYQYSKNTASSVTYTSWGDSIRSLSDNSATTLPSAKDSIQDKASDNETTIEKMNQSAKDELMEQLKQTTNRMVFMESNVTQVVQNDMEYESMKNVFELLFLKDDPNKVSAKTLFDRLLASYRARLEKMLLPMLDEASSSLQQVFVPFGYSGGNLEPTQVWGEEITVTDFTMEQEKTCFYSSGTVKTKEGKEINFDVQAVMSRSFLSYSSVNIDYVSASMVDPLVINLNSDVAQLSDQKFLFDLDLDGKEDNISLLSQGCAFLAQDLNGDGKINDGSELFGAKTGDGFGELAIFDMDQNGWIDEQDEIFNHLRVWHKDEEGNDELVALGVAGIGAIYLGNKETRFALKNVMNNQHNGTVKKTGIFLKEDGTAGTIQHVDLAK